MDIQALLIHKFFQDIVLMGALFRAGFLNIASVREVADSLLSTSYGKFGGYDDETLISIVVSYNDERIADDFNKFLDDYNVKIEHPKQMVVAKVFYYILENKLDFWAGMSFLYHVVQHYEYDEDFSGILLDYEHNLNEYRDDPEVHWDYAGNVLSVLNDMKQYCLTYLGHTPNDTDIEMVSNKIMSVVTHKISQNTRETAETKPDSFWAKLRKALHIS